MESYWRHKNDKTSVLSPNYDIWLITCDANYPQFPRSCRYTARFPLARITCTVMTMVHYHPTTLAALGETAPPLDQGGKMLRVPIT